MKLLEKIFKKILLEQAVNISDIDDALDNHKRVIINYHTKGENNNIGARVAEVYAYGSTEAGNPVIRVFQPYGDTTTRVPGWKFMRLDRISGWEATNQTFDTPANERYPGLGDFNPDGDETMSIVYKVANFGDSQIPNAMDKEEPKTNSDVYKTDSEIDAEKNMARLRQQVDNPIKLSDIKVGDAFRQLPNKPKPTTSQPKTKEDVYKIPNENPNEKTPEDRQKDLDKLRKTLGDKPISLSDLNKKMKEEVPQDTKWEDVFDKQAERDLNQMNKDRNQMRRDRRWQKSADSRPLNRKGSLNREEI